MNTRLEIASRVLAGMMADSGNRDSEGDLVRTSIQLADALIAAAEEATRKVDEHPISDPDTINRIQSLRSNVWGMIVGDNNRIAQLNTIIRSLDAILDDARRRGTTPNHGTLSGYRIDLAAAQIAYDANPSAKNASILSAAKEALARRQS